MLLGPRRSTSLVTQVRFLLILLGVALLSTACGGSRFLVKGRIAIVEDADCNAPNDDYQKTSWEQCHAFKRHFDPKSGMPIVSNNPAAGALRPFRGGVFVHAYPVGPGPIPKGTKRCGTWWVQTSLDGYFNALLPSCGKPGDPLQLRFIATLTYQLTTVPGDGIIRGAWRQNQIEPLYSPDIQIDPFPSFLREWDTVENGRPVSYVQPKFDVAISMLNGEPAAGSTVDVGTQVLLQQNPPPPRAFEYLRYVLLTWNDLVELHQRLRQVWVDANQPSAYQKIFVKNPAENCEPCFTVEYVSDFASFAVPGGIRLHNPEPDLVWSPEGVATPLGHEFGHTIHSAFAPGSLNLLQDPSFGSSTRTKAGVDTAGIHHDGELQEMGVAFKEGIATTIGQYLVNGCDGQRSYDQLVIRANLQGPLSNYFSGDASCDQTNSITCSYLHFRWHMNQRGIAEDSQEWNRRLALLQALAQKFNVVSSNSETRWSQFACDLLDNTSSLDQLGNLRPLTQITGRLEDYLLHVGRILNGEAVDVDALPFTKYLVDEQPENVRLTLPQLLEAMDQFYDGAGVPLAMTDPAYPPLRLSVRGRAAPQALGLYLVKKGWITKDQLNNVLRTNFMEEVP
ncbi:MAG TPA: hypothetical protein VGM22_01155 [Methylomirabilota bacterium]|jgi:hypothetical protein